MATKRLPPMKNSGCPQRGKAQVRWWKRPITWIAGLISALILAIVAAIGNGIGSTLFTAINHNASTGRPDGRVSGGINRPAGQDRTSDTAQYQPEQQLRCTGQASTHRGPTYYVEPRECELPRRLPSSQSRRSC